MGFACDNDLPIFSEIILVLRGSSRFTQGQIESWLRLVKRYEDGNGPVPDVINRPPLGIPDAINRAMYDPKSTAAQKMQRLMEVKQTLETLL